MRLTRRALAPAAVLTVAAGTLTYLGTRPEPARPAPFTVVDDPGSSGGRSAPGIVLLGQLAMLRVTAPFTLVKVTPLRTDPAVDLVAVRALFWGRDGSRTRSGYQRVNNNPGSACANWPLTGHGPTYPIENLTLQPGDDTLSLQFYIRSLTPGIRSAYGYRIIYRTPDGRTGIVSGGGEQQLVMELYPPSQRPPGLRYHVTCETGEFGRPVPGYPT